MANPPNKKTEEKPKSRSSFALLALLLVVIFVVAVYFFVWPEYGVLTDSQNKLAEEKQSLDEQNQTFLNIKKLLANYGEISDANKGKVEAMIPEVDDEPGLFTLFEAVGQKNKITISAIDISEKEAAPVLANLGLREVDVALNLTINPASADPYGDFKRFLGDLENNLRLMDVVSVNYTPESSNCILNIRTYRLETVSALPARTATPATP